MYTFPMSKPKPSPKRPPPRTMLDGHKPAARSSRTRRAASENDDPKPSHRSASPDESLMLRDMESHRNTANPMKKRMLLVWDAPSRTGAGASASSPRRNGRKPAPTAAPPPAKTHTPKEKETPQLATETSEPREAVTEQPQTPRRRYPKLLKVDNDGHIVANPLKLADGIPPPAPLVVKGDKYPVPDACPTPGPSHPRPKSRHPDGVPREHWPAGSAHSHEYPKTAPPHGAANGLAQHLDRRASRPAWQPSVSQGMGDAARFGYGASYRSMPGAQQNTAQVPSGMLNVPHEEQAWGPPESDAFGSQIVDGEPVEAPGMGPGFRTTPLVTSARGSEGRAPVDHSGVVRSEKVRPAIAPVPRYAQGYQFLAYPVPRHGNVEGHPLAPRVRQYTGPPRRATPIAPRGGLPPMPTNNSMRPHAGPSQTIRHVRTSQPTQAAARDRAPRLADARIHTSGAEPPDHDRSQSRTPPEADVIALKGSQLSASERAKKKNAEKVIQVGKRCGTVEYWRSSLQMPKNAGVKKSTPKNKALVLSKRLPAAVQKQVSPPLMQGSSVSDGTTSLWPTSVLGGVESRQGKVGPERGLVDPNVTRTPLDTGQHHAFWRNSTKLPSVSSDKARQRRLAEGKRKALVGEALSSPSTVRQGEEVEAATRQNGSERLHGSNDGARSQAMGEFEGEEGVNQVGPQYSDIGNGNPGVEFGVGERKGKTPQEIINEEQDEMRKLHMTKDYELRKLEVFAESRYHVKMNLRGRSKLENWLSSNDLLTAHSVMFLVLVLNLDRRLVSRSAVDRKQALEEMDNEHLRMLEALMTRTSARDGHANWLHLTANFSAGP